MCAAPTAVVEHPSVGSFLSSRVEAVERTYPNRDKFAHQLMSDFVCKMVKFKLIYVVIDGMADRPVPELGGKTPLENASTPNLDLLARRGKTGLMYTVRKGIAPESDVAVISILGYDPFKFHTGRGPLEAYGAGLTVREGELSLRCNYATLGENRRIRDRRVGRDLTTEEAAVLTEAVNLNVRLKSHPAFFEFKSTIRHRGVLVIRADIPLSGAISNTDPAYARSEGIGVARTDGRMMLEDAMPLEETESARNSAELVNEFVHESHLVLDRHEINKKRIAQGRLSANVILTRDAGDRLPRFPRISDLYGVRFACLADMPVERGIGRLADMTVVDLPPPSNDLVGDCKLRLRKLLSLMDLYDCFYVHIKGPDEPGHDGDAQLKTTMISQIDRSFFGDLVSELDLGRVVVCVTSDHSTSCITRGHSDDPVPILVSGNNIQGDGLEKFSETECAKGSLGILPQGVQLMPILMKNISPSPIRKRGFE